MEPNNNLTQWKSSLVDPNCIGMLEFYATTADKEWRTVTLAPGLHVRVYESGFIQWLDYGNAGPKGPMFIKTSKGSLSGGVGYRQVKIDGKNHYVHRLVAQAWLPNPDNKSQVDHINGDRSHNHVINLRWATPIENMANVHNGLYPKEMDLNMPRGKTEVLAAGAERRKELSFYNTDFDFDYHHELTPNTIQFLKLICGLPLNEEDQAAYLHEEELLRDDALECERAEKRCEESSFTQFGADKSDFDFDFE